jgi:alanyl-tRNA synthetase
LLAKIIARVKTAQGGEIPGEDAFVLYDTHGFPLELTQEIAAEQGLTVDEAGFQERMKAQQETSKGSHETIDLTAQGTLDRLAQSIEPTQFLGYGQTQEQGKILALLVKGQRVEQVEAGTSVQVVLDQTPFYGESGGQVGDHGWLTTGQAQVRIEDVQKKSGLFVHFGTVEQGTLLTTDTIAATVDPGGRRRVQANHTATHLLQAALRKIVDPDISQAGSLVDFERLRFDFNSPRAVAPEELEQIEHQINTWIGEGHGAAVAEMPLEAAKAQGAIAMFGEKYAAQVRVVDFPGVSMELCGGTHVNNTAEIGAFKIISETGISTGVRRIEAVAGPAIFDYLQVRDQVVKNLGERFKAKPEEICDRVATLQEELKSAQKQLAALHSELAVAKSDSVLAQAEAVGNFQVLVAELEGVDANALKTAAERLQQKLGSTGAVLLGSIPTLDKVSLVAAFGPEVNQQGLQAGKFVGTIAKLCGGGGGGRPNLAQAGGRDPSKLQEALVQAKQKLLEGLAN